MFALVPLILIISFTMVFMASSERAWRTESDTALLTWLGAMSRVHRTALALALEDERIQGGAPFTVEMPRHRVFQFAGTFTSLAFMDTRRPDEANGGAETWRAVVTYAPRPTEGILTARDIGNGEETGRIGIVGARRLSGGDRIFGIASNEGTEVSGYELPSAVSMEIQDGYPVLVTRVRIAGGEDTSGGEEDE